MYSLKRACLLANGMFVGKGYACDDMIKLNVEMNENSSFAYIVSCVNVWHGRLCHINSKYNFLNLKMNLKYVKSVV